MTKESGPLWGGRFSKPPAGDLMSFSSSIAFDVRLAPQEVRATRAHAHALRRAGLITADEVGAIESALDEADRLFSEGRFEFDISDEDVHSALERFLIERVGESGAKIHAGRSRNDLVVADLRLWLKSEIGQIRSGIDALMRTLAGRAREHASTITTGYTHLQRAQPVFLGHLLLAHAFALARDFERMGAAYLRADVSPLGAGAMAGTTLPIDPAVTASELGFAGVFDNAADAVADRDFALEFLAGAAICGVHLSRLAEEIVLWTSSEFAFATLDDAYATGSSIMPQKKNPDVAELARARSSRLVAHLVHLLGAMKGLPLAYNRDLQEDKEPVFGAADVLSGMLSVLTGVMGTLRFDPDRMQTAVRESGATATDLAEALVLAGVPFRQAHEIVGRLVAKLESEGRLLASISAEELAAFDDRFTSEMVRLIDPRRSAEARRSHGGTAPERIAEQLRTLDGLLESQAADLEKAVP